MCVMVVVAIVRPMWFGCVVRAGLVMKQDRTCCSCLGVDGQVWSLTGLVSIEGDVNFKNLTAGFVDVYCDSSLNDIRVDANLCDLQDKASWGIVEREVVTNRARKRRSEV
ncbi:hypothetical protein Taro_000805 [Colocasia esculenta]|uniref:Uncharacterized protein n=1 Tax=Colocasia esculenta TaxID=4460 RepID=A0A843TIY8_COLES|nr:hypothetical protein [Colocasia esculenta]